MVATLSDFALRRRKIALLAAVAAVGAVGFGAPANAEGDDIPAFSMTWYSDTLGEEAPYNLLDDYGLGPATVESDGLLHMRGINDYGLESGYFAVQWDVYTTEGTQSAAGGGAANVTADLSVTNFSATRQVFWALVTVALDDPILGATDMNGSISASVVDLTDGEADITTPQSGAFAGDPMYDGLIDGVSARTLFDDGYQLSASGPIGADNNDDASFAGETGPGAINNISVWLKVEVSPLDTVNLVGFFEVAPIPAPAALPMLAMFGLAAGRRRRRN